MIQKESTTTCQTVIVLMYQLRRAKMKMSESFKILVGYSKYLINIFNYDSWRDEEIEAELKEKEKQIKEDFQKTILENEIDFSELNEVELQLLGFSKSGNDFYIPIWIYELLPDDTKLISFDGKIKIKKDIKFFYEKFGVIAYRLMGKMDYEV
jgi:hypothetical protein